MEQASALWTYIIGVAWNSHRSGVPYAPVVEDAPLDKKLPQMELPACVQSAATLSTEELALRWQGIRDFQVNELKEKNKKLKQGSSLRKEHPLLYKVARKVLGGK